MRIRFTKMQGAGNDFVVLDETRARLNLSAAQYRFLGDRHFGVGADQILTVRPAPSPEVDFEYVIHNSADGGEVEHCGNGARCFVRYVRDQGLTDNTSVRVKVKNGVLTLSEQADGRVSVDMGAPVFELAQIPFDATGLAPVPAGATPDHLWQLWPLDLKPNQPPALANSAQAAMVNVAVLSMGNPHAVQLVGDVTRRRWPRTARSSSATRPSRTASTPASCRSWIAATSACACTSAARAKRWPAAPAPARRWWRASGSDCWTHASTCKRAAAR